MMYCRHCGKELPENARYCNNCGAEQKQNGNPQTAPRQVVKQDIEIPSVEEAYQGSGKKGWAVAVLGLGVGVFLWSVLAGGFGESGKPVSAPAPAETVLSQREQAPETMQSAEETKAPPRYGWYEQDGKTYYYRDGEVATGIWTIDGEKYYFAEHTGEMYADTEIEVDGNVLTLDADGKLTHICYAVIPGTWSDEKFNFGNGGRSSILVLEETVENCVSVDLYIEAQGLYGSSVDGNWKVHLRIDGKWQEVQTFAYSGTSGQTTITFDTPVTFDAVTAYPTRQGNASYQSAYIPVNVLCEAK